MIIGNNLHVCGVLCVSEHLKNLLNFLICENVELIVLHQLVVHNSFNLSWQRQACQFWRKTETSTFWYEWSGSRKQYVWFVLLDTCTEPCIHAILFGLNLHAPEKDCHFTVFVESVWENWHACDPWLVHLRDEILRFLDYCESGVINRLFIFTKIGKGLLVVQSACLLLAWDCIKQVDCLLFLFTVCVCHWLITVYSFILYKIQIQIQII